MFLTFYLLFIGLHVSEECTLVKDEHESFIKALTGGSGLLPCYCTDLQIRPETITWKKLKKTTKTWEVISIDRNIQDRDRVELVNGHSPGNLSLLISHLTEDDSGMYRCYSRADELVEIILIVEGCNLENREQLLTITAHTGGSVLLPCYCTDLHTTPEGFSWKKYNTKTNTWEVISSESGQLFNDHSKGNLSLLISHLTEEDGGDYFCAVKDSHVNIRLTLQERPPKPITPAVVDKMAESAGNFLIVSLCFCVYSVTIACSACYRPCLF
ncbi:hypothetical protein MHYP_G00050250 [Metynnis hypsauchen]